MPEDFYKEQVFKQIDDRLNQLFLLQQQQSEKLNNIDSKVNWIYAWAGGVATIVTIIGFWIKNKILKG